MTLFALCGLFVTSTVYALLLSTPLGIRWTLAQGWTTVVAGTLLVLGWMALVDWRSALLGLLFFAVGGAPLVARSLILQFRERERIVRRAIDRD